MSLPKTNNLERTLENSIYFKIAMSKSVSDNTTHEMINQICEELHKLYIENKTLKAQITEYEILLETCLKQNTKIKELKEQLKVKSNPVTHSDSDSDCDSDLNTAAKSTPKVKFDEKKLQKLRNEFTKKKKKKD